MNYNLKKENEVYHLKYFLNCLKKEEKTAEIVKNEPPDFIIKTKTGNISIEHSVLYNKSLKENEAVLSKIVKTAKSKFNRICSTKLYVLVTFNDNIKKIGKNKILIIEKVFNIVESIYIDNKHSEFNINYSLSEDPFIDDIYVTNKLEIDHWQPFGAYSTRVIDTNFLNEKITNKNFKIKHYKQIFKEKWLLLVANIGTKSSAYNFDQYQLNCCINEFDKIYIYMLREDEIISIK